MLKNTAIVSNAVSHVTIKLNKDTANFTKPPSFHKKHCFWACELRCVLKITLYLLPEGWE